MKKGIRATLAAAVGSVAIAALVIGGGIALADEAATFRFQPANDRSSRIDFIPNPNGGGNLASAVILEVGNQAGASAAGVRLDITVTGTIRATMPAGTTTEFPGQPLVTGLAPPCSGDSLVAPNTIHKFCTLGPLPVGGEIDTFIFFTRSATDGTVDPPVTVRVTAIDANGDPITFQNGAGFQQLSLPVFLD